MPLFSCPNRRPNRRFAALSGALAAISGTLPLLFRHGHSYSHDETVSTLIGMGCGVGFGIAICLYKKRRDRMNPYLYGRR